MMPVKKSAKNDVSDGAFARLQHNSRYSLEFDVGLDETSPTYELTLFVRPLFANVPAAP